MYNIAKNTMRPKHCSVQEDKIYCTGCTQNGKTYCTGWNQNGTPREDAVTDMGGALLMSHHRQHDCQLNREWIYETGTGWNMLAGPE